MRELLSICLAVIMISAATSGSAQGLSSMEQDVVRLVDEVSKSIVSVAAISGNVPSSGRSPFTSAQTAKSVGCGVIFDKEGLILTTASVVGYTEHVEVVTHDGHKLRAAVVGIDPESDIAVVKVDRTDLKPAPFGSGGGIRPGSMIFVLGNAFGSLPSVSMGVVSNVTGPVVDARGDAVLRLSVPINPGDIGGPVVSSGGEVIGIVIGRLTFRSGYRSIRMGEGAAFGFAGGALQTSNMTVALPTARVIDVARDIVRTGGTERGFLGVQVVDVSDEIRESMGTPDLRGVRVTHVVGGSPAESIGLRVGDIITALGPRSVETVEFLRDAISGFGPGDLVDISYLRGERSSSDVVRVTRRMPEFVREASLAEEQLKPDELRARINSLRFEIERLNQQLKELEQEE
jgi:S1-C subfamily serine protease